MAADKPKPPWAASSQAEVARFFGVNPDTVKRWRAQGMPASRGSYPLDAIVQWLRTEGPWRERHPVGSPDDDDLEGDRCDSPALERYRAAKADMAEMERDERAGKLLSLAHVKEIFGMVARVIRQAAGQLERNHGVLAKRIVTDALQKARTELHRGVGEHGSDGLETGGD